MVAKISGSGEPRSIIESRHSAGPSFTRSEDLEPDNSRWSIELFVVVICCNHSVSNCSGFQLVLHLVFELGLQTSYFYVTPRSHPT